MCRCTEGGEKRFATRQFMKHNMWNGKMSLVSPVGDFGWLWLSSLSYMFVETPQVGVCLCCVV